MHKEIQRKNHTLLCRSIVISTDIIGQGKSVNNKSSYIARQHFTSLSSTLTSPMKTQGKYLKPTFCYLALVLRPQQT